ncbi:hypothetical protein BJ875DRAFT_208991 [Amylocarpus encephaloides]|uniref:Uncharacterized protein n=1 Tax=Amylocarpus encephaloides TaxID=45428 RepID=A0A9P7YMS1_9HELO|nr:hypothetical protein BJ875DRAFT_208991 [Amylocarpus encephaloides]
MPLITKLHPRGDRDMRMHGRVHDASLPCQRSQDGHEHFPDFKDGELSSDMEGSVIHRARPKRVVRAPLVPPRSERRASTMLKDVMLELQRMDGVKEPDMAAPSQTPEEGDPHQLYLSSEEEGSLSDYDEDSLLDFEPAEADDVDLDARASSSSSSRASRKPAQITARVVSLTLVKPQIVEIHSPTISPATPPRPSSAAFESASIRSRPRSPFDAQSTSSRSASPSRPPAPRRPSPLHLYPSSTRRMSVASASSLTNSLGHSSSHSIMTSATTTSTQPPQRKTSRIAALALLVTQSLHHPSSHSFLSTDPFPSQPNSAQPSPSKPTAPADVENEPPTTPRTPTSMASSVVRRGLYKARTPSMQKLHAAFASKNSSALNLSAPPPAESFTQPSPARQRRTSVAFPSEASVPEDGPAASTPWHQAPVRYEDIMRNAIKSPPPTKSPDKKKTNSFLALGRRKSLRAV